MGTWVKDSEELRKHFQHLKPPVDLLYLWGGEGEKRVKRNINMLSHRNSRNLKSNMFNGRDYPATSSPETCFRRLNRIGFDMQIKANTLFVLIYMNKMTSH